MDREGVVFVVENLHWVFESEWMLSTFPYAKCIWGKFNTWLYAVGHVLRWAQANVIYNVICLLFNLLFIWGVACFGRCFFVCVLFRHFTCSFCWHPLLFWLICLSRSMKSIRIQNVIKTTLKPCQPDYYVWFQQIQ